MQKRTVGIVVAALVMAAAAGHAAAQQAGKAASGGFVTDPKGWKFEVTPYAWLAGMEGDVTVDGHKAEFDKSFSDLFDAVELAASLRLGAQYDRYVVGAVVDYVSLSTDKLDVDDQPEHGSLDAKTLLTEAAAGYRIDGWAEGQSFVLMLGVRNFHMETDLEVFGLGTFSKDNDITDPMFFVLPSLPVLPSKIDGLRFNPVLGIGAGGDSDLAYELFPQFQYQITDRMAARLGYRTVGWKFKGDNNEDNELNFSMSGLIAGVGLTF